MKKFALIFTALLITITVSAKIHAVYGYNETHLLTLESGKNFHSSNKVDSSKGVFVYETMQKPKMIKIKTKEGKTITISDTSSLLGFDKSFTLFYSLQQLENSRKFVFVYNDEKVVTKNGVDYYAGALLPANKKLTLAYVMQYLGQVQDYYIIERDAEIKAEQQRRIDDYNDSIFLVERANLASIKKQAMMNKVQGALEIMNAIVADRDVWQGRVSQKNYTSNGLTVDAKFRYTSDTTTVGKKTPEEDIDSSKPKQKKLNTPTDVSDDDGPYAPFMP